MSRWGVIYRQYSYEYPVATTVGNYALIAGGENSAHYVAGFSSALTAVSVPELTTGRVEFDGTTIGNYALFAGGIWAYYQSAGLHTV